MSTFLYINQPFGYFLCEISCPFSFSLSVFFSFVAVVYFVDTSPLIFFRLCHIAYQIFIPLPEIEPMPLAMESQVWTTGLLGNSPFVDFVLQTSFPTLFAGFWGWVFVFFFWFLLYFLINRVSDFHVVQIITLYLWLVFLFVLSVKLLSTSKS